MIKEREDSVCIYLENNRQDLADDEYAQIKVLDQLLPPLPTKEDIEKYINEHYPNGVDKKQMGNVIKEVKNNLVGADGREISEVVKTKLI